MLEVRDVMLAILVAAVVLGAQGTAAAAQTAAEPAPAQAEADLKPGQERVKVRCRDEVSTGSRFTKRKCRRLDDMARMEEDAREAIGNVNRLPSLPPGSN